MRSKNKSPAAGMVEAPAQTRPPGQTRQLRVDAEAELARVGAQAATTRTTEQLLHELQVHQIELEMQNENLRQSQFALRESLDRYVDLYEFAPVVYLTLSGSGRIAEINLTGATLFGETRSALINRSFASFVLPEEQDHWSLQFRHALNHAERRACEIHLQRQDGKIFYASLVFLLASRRDTTAPLRIALTDITARKSAEGEFTQASLAVTQSPVSIIVTDTAGNIVYVNPAFTATTGYAAAEALGMNPRMLNSGRTPPQTFVDLWAALAAGKSWHGEFINRRKDGTEYREFATISPLRQAGGAITHYVAVRTDVTELSRALSMVQFARLEKGAAGLGVFDIDILADRHDWDSMIRGLWGFGPEEPIDSAAFLGGVHPEDRAALQASYKRFLDPLGDEEDSAEYRVVNRVDGTVHHVLTNAQRIVEAGRVVRVVGALRDVSAEKELELKRQERRQNMRLLDNQQVASQTAAAIAHELNQPLVAISAYSEAALCMLRTGEDSPDNMLRALQGAVDQAQRAGKTLHELLEFLQKGDQEPAPIDLNVVVHSALATAVEVGCVGFLPQVDLEPDLKPVLANRLQLEKVILNLLNNGVDAMRGTGISMAAITITARTLEADNMAQVTLQDSGPGLTAEVAQRIFQPFFTTKSDGIGLGLSISRALVESFGGRLWLDVDSSAGAIFHFTVPFAP